MAWWGKVVGGSVGFWLGGPLGAVLGVALGHQLDKSGRADAESRWDDHERIQTAFFTATFSVMGHIAKADGRVSEDEIAFAGIVMDHMSLDADQRRLARELFRQGKEPDFDLGAVMAQFRRECQRRQNLIQMFVEIQLQVALADGNLDPGEHTVLMRLGDMLGIRREVLEQLITMVAAARNFDSRDTAGYHESTMSRAAQLQQAYAVLGVVENVEDGEVKRAYRRLMNQHHPDKLVARGLPEEMVQLANQKVHEIKAAYELIANDRGMR